MSDLGNKRTMSANINRLMKRNGIDRRKLSNDLNVSYTTLADWINAKTYPRIDKIESMAKYFHVDKASLVEDQLRSVYDPAVGSGSLLLNVGQHVAKPDLVSYHGQELNTTTYNLARMNLMLHGVKFEDMDLRNGDTLSIDWPTEEPYQFDAVVMNPQLVLFMEEAEK